MSSALKVLLVQKKGQLAIPTETNPKLGLAEGDVVAFIETQESIIISPGALCP